MAENNLPAFGVSVPFIPDNPPNNDQPPRWQTSQKTNGPPVMGVSIPFEPHNASTASDVGQSVAAQSLLAPADIVGFPGSIGQAWDYATAQAKKFPGYFMDPLGTGAGVIPSTASTTKVPDQSPYEPMANADTNKFGAFNIPSSSMLGVNTPSISSQGIDLPTVQGAEKAIKGYIPAAGYEPQTTAGKVTGAAARFATGAALTGGLGEIPEAVSAVRSGAGLLAPAARIAGTSLAEGAKNIVPGLVSEGAGQWAENTGNDKWASVARITGALTGQGASALTAKLASPVTSKISDTVSSMVFPNDAARRELATALGKDFATDPDLYTKTQAAIAAGAAPTVYDMGGDATRAVLQKYGFLSDDAKAATTTLNKAIQQRDAISGSVVGNHIEETLGLPNGALNAGKLQSDINDANSKINDRFYDVARNDPKANEVLTPALEKMLSDSVDIKSAAKKTIRDATAPGSNIQVYNPGTKDQIVNTGLIDSSGNPITKTIPGNKPQAPNLDFWQSVKENLDGKISQARLSGDTSEVRRLSIIKNNLTDEVDAVVPAYVNARSAASEGYGASNAVEAGYNAMKNVNTFDANEFIKNYNSFTPEEKDMAQKGAAGFLKEHAYNNGAKSIVNMMENPNSQERMRLFLGDSTFDSIYGRAKAEDWLNQTKQITPGSINTPNSFVRNVALQAVPPAATLAAQAIYYGAPTTWYHALPAAGVAGAVYAGRHVSDAAERAMAPTVMRLAASPESAEQLGNLARTNASARAAMNNIAEHAQRIIWNTVRATPPSQAYTRPTQQYTVTPQTQGQPVEQSSGGAVARATGGRVGDHHERLVSRLMTLAERAKKDVNSTTEPLLNVPDATIVKALHVANQAI